MPNSECKTKTLSRDEIQQLGALTDTAGVCSILGCSERYARLLCAQGVFKAVKMGREWRANVASVLEFAGLE